MAELFEAMRIVFRGSAPTICQTSSVDCRVTVRSLIVDSHGADHTFAIERIIADTIRLTPTVADRRIRFSKDFGWVWV